MKKILVCFIFLFSFQSQAGLFDWKYFEPTAACLGAGGISYLGSNEDDRMQNAAISCAIGGAIGFLIQTHYQNKYGQEFEARKLHYAERLQKFKMLEEQSGMEIEPGAPYMIKRRLVPAQKTRNGDLILPTVHESIIMKDSSDRIGR